MEWETEIPIEVCKSYGMPQMHGAFFQHKADLSEKNPNVVVVMLPETGRDVFASAMMDAHTNQSRVAIIADTADQVRQGVAFATERLPMHDRVSMVRAASGGWLKQ